MPYDTNTDAITNAVLALQAAGWQIVDGDGDSVIMRHPDAEASVVIEFGSPNED